MEEEEAPVYLEDNRIVFPIAPYEIKTFKVWLAEKLASQGVRESLTPALIPGPSPATAEEGPGMRAG